MHIQRHILLVAIAILFSGCASQPKHAAPIEQLESWQATGKLGFKNGDFAKSVSFQWKNASASEFDIRLYGALGIGTTRLSQTGGIIKLSNKNGVRQASSAEELLASELGWQIPVSDLTYWIKGHASPAAIEQQTFYPNGNIEHLYQQGWHLHFKQYHKVGKLDLPKKMIAERGPIRLTFIVKTWKL